MKRSFFIDAHEAFIYILFFNFSLNSFFSGVQEGRESDEHRDYEGGRFLKDLGDGGGLHQEDV